MNMKNMLHIPVKTTVVACLLMLTAGFAGCGDDEVGEVSPQQETPQNANDEEEAVTYNDLSFFQNSIIEVDEQGNVVCHYIGVALYESEPLHLYVGVDSYEEAEEMFRQWLAPDVTATATANGLSARLTDKEGKDQGTVTFTKAEGTSVAEVTASAGTRLKHFNQVTFLLNDAWPHNPARPTIRVGDIIKASLVGADVRFLKDNDVVLDWICIQAEKNGVKPIFVAVTRNAYDRGHYGINNTHTLCKLLKESRYCPGMERAKAISDILKKRWGYFCNIYDAAGCGKLSGDGFWIDHEHGTFFTYNDYMYYSSGVTYGANDSSWSSDSSMKRHFLFKIDWMSDSEITSMMVPTAGTNIPGYPESYINLFDNNTNTKWYVQAAQKQNGVWFVEFNGQHASKWTGYKLYTGGDTNTYPQRNPVAWKLYGKTYEGDEWKLLDERDTEKNSADALPNSNGAEKSYTFNNSKLLQYFRLEISKSKGNNDMQLSRIQLTL